MSMRRNYPITRRHQKDFINTYHINEVPLPYYNPLEDPYLKTFFNNRKVSNHIQDMKFVYRPREQYPYHQRRSKNAHKFLKPNLCQIPSSHVLPHNNYENKSCLQPYHQNEWSTPDNQSAMKQPQMKRRAESDILVKTTKRNVIFNDLLSKRPNSINFRKSYYSSTGKSKSGIFQKRNVSNGKRENAQDQSGNFA